MIFVKYENFVNNPVEEVASICERIGVDFERTMLDVPHMRAILPMVMICDFQKILK